VRNWPFAETPGTKEFAEWGEGPFWWGRISWEEEEEEEEEEEDNDDNDDDDEGVARARE